METPCSEISMVICSPFFFLIPQLKEVANINGEKAENASEEEESEDVESEEEERQQRAAEPAGDVKEANRTYEPISQVGTRELFSSFHIALASHEWCFLFECVKCGI